MPAAAAVGAHVVLLYFADPIEHIEELVAQAPFTVEPVCWAMQPPGDLAPKITLSSTQGPSNGGNKVQVLGNGWTPNTAVKLFWDDPSLCPTISSYCLGQVTTDALGKFLTSFTVPTIAAAVDHEVVARNHPYVAPVQYALAAYRMVDPPSPPSGDNQAPTVFVGHSIDQAYVGGPPVSVYLSANAWDQPTSPGAYNGIVRVELWAYAFGGSYPSIHKKCQVTGWTPSLSCLHHEGGPWAPSILGFYYWAQAEDRAGNVTTSPVKFAWLVNTGSDKDNDGLSDAVEQIICTSPQNPDTDRDNLLDGWEVEGYGFSDGHFVDLPSMGAHPCIPDSFVEIDWLASQQPNLQSDLQPVVNAYKDHGIQLHIDHGQWGGGEQIASKQSAAQNHFDPHRLWSFHYTIFQPSGRSSCWRGKVAFVSAGRRSQTFMHELGHCTSLGHGGTSGPNTQKRSGTAPQRQKWGFQWVWYDKDTVTMNNKANYPSVMSYAWNGLVWVPGTGFVFPHDYSEKALPPLNESNLDERATSAFIKALRAYPLPPGVAANSVVATMYSCLDPDDGNIYIMVTDGHQLLARHRRGDPWPNWQLTNLPAQDKIGIDWDCDGTIEPLVSTNINGCSGECFLNSAQAGWQPGQAVTRWTPNESFTSTADWTRIPAIDPCIGDSALGSGYLQSAHDPPCESNGWAAASGSVREDDPPWQHVPPGEWCNGEDDDGDGSVDEGCADRDEDGVVDELDNCPLTANAEQEDGDRDLAGDACSQPPPAPAGLTAHRAEGTVLLTWQPVEQPDIVGYNIYRRLDGEAVFRFLGETWPVTANVEFVDDIAPDGPVAYQVRAVSRNGLESEPAETLTRLVTCPGDADCDSQLTPDDVDAAIRAVFDPVARALCSTDCDEDGAVTAADILCVIERVGMGADCT